MRAAIAGIMAAVLVVAAGYFGLPALIGRETAGIRGDLSALHSRVETTERFVREEEEARKTFRVEPGADAQAIVRLVNALGSRVSSLEGSYRKDHAAVESALAEQKDASAAALRKQGEAHEKDIAEIRARLGEIAFRATISAVRQQLLNIKTDLQARNVGTADSEMARTIELMEKARGTASPGAAKVLDGAIASLRKARGEMNADLPAAMKRVDLLWHEVGKARDG